MAVSSVAVVPHAPKARTARRPGPSRPENVPAAGPIRARRAETREELAVVQDVALQPREGANPNENDPIPVGEVLRLVASLQDLPVEVRSAVLMRVFRQGSGSDHQS